MKRQNFSAIILTAFCLFYSHFARAQTLYVSDLGTSGGGDIVTHGIWEAAEFTTGADTGGYDLNSVQAVFYGTGSGFNLELYSDNSGQPGAMLGTLNGPTPIGTGGTYTYTASSNIPLSASTSYWIIAGAGVNSGSFNWEQTGTTSFTENDGWVLHNTYDILMGTTWLNETAATQQYDIYATPVPEPSALALGSLALLALFLRRKK